MSKASSLISSFNRTQDKKLIRIHTRQRAVDQHRVNKDEIIYHFKDGSALIDRHVVNEFQLFRGPD